MCFLPDLAFGCVCVGGGGSPNGVVHNLPLQFFTLGSSKIEVSETCFFDIRNSRKHHPSHVKQVLGCIYVFFTLFGYWVQGGGGSFKGLVEHLLMQLPTPILREHALLGDAVPASTCVHTYCDSDLALWALIVRHCPPLAASTIACIHWLTHPPTHSLTHGKGIWRQGLIKR